MWINIQEKLASGGEIKLVDQILLPVFVYERSERMCIIEYIVYDTVTRACKTKLHQLWPKYRLNHVWLPPSLVFAQALFVKDLNIIEESFYNCYNPAWNQ